MTAKCYRCFYRLRISPASGGRAFLATCCNNMFRSSNHAIIKNKVRTAWNSPQFRVQRKLSLENDWSYCKGSSCFFYPYFDESRLTELPLVKNAIAEKKNALDYLPQAVNIIPSYSCNNNCFMCYHVCDRDAKTESRLSDELLKELEDEIVPSADSVTISGGEPFYSERTMRFVDRIMSAQPAKRLLINTNGVLLEEYGIDKIVETNIFLNISVYGMNGLSYQSVTGKSNFEAVFKNVRGLLDRGYQNMRLIFIVSSKNHADIGRFCEFVGQNGEIKAMVRNNCFEGPRFRSLMKDYAAEYRPLAHRLKFISHEESILNSMARRLYDPFLLLKYHLDKGSL